MNERIINGRYRLRRVLGEGGMARVYEAEDLRLGRRVAVKVLLPQYTRDPEFLRRFEQEARLAASLSHPNVVGVYDVGQDGELHYIVMELVDGQTLKDAIAAARPMPVPEAVRIAIEVCAALSAAHARGMVHRDIKPQNILLTADRQVKVADFGIARRGAATAVTQTGTVLGSVHYLSPEQARGQDASPRSDLYALGITLFEMLTGRLPFNAENPIAVAMQQVQNAPPLPRQFNRAIPPALEAIILRLLAKNPNERFPDAASVVAALRGVLGQAGGATRVATPAAGSPQQQRGAPPPTRVMPPTGQAPGAASPTGFAAPSGIQQVQVAAPPVVTKKTPSGRRSVLAGVIVGGVVALLVVLALAILSTGGNLPGLTGGATATPTPTDTPMPTPRPTHTPRPIIVAPAATHTPTATPRPTHTRVPTATGTPFPTVTQSASFTPTLTPVPPTDTPTETPLPSLTPTETPRPSATPTDTATPAPSATATVPPSETPTALPSATPTETPSATPAPATQTPTATDTAVPSTSTPFIAPFTETPTPALSSETQATPPAGSVTPAAGTPATETPVQSPGESSATPERSPSLPLFNRPTPVPTPTFLG